MGGEISIPTTGYFCIPTDIHIVRVEQAKTIDQPRGAAFIEAGARACPPEDAGGPPGYQEFLDRLAADPRDEEVASFLQWAGEDFDPDRFDRRSANAALLRWLGTAGARRSRTQLPVQDGSHRTLTKDPPPGGSSVVTGHWRSPALWPG